MGRRVYAPTFCCTSELYQLPGSTSHPTHPPTHHPHPPHPRQEPHPTHPTHLLHCLDVFPLCQHLAGTLLLARAAVDGQQARPRALQHLYM